MSGKLDGLAVLVTRPAQSAETLVAALREQGATAIVQPALETAGVALEQRDLAMLAALSDRDWLVFTSPAAVEFALPQLPRPRNGPRCWAVGATTAALLQKAWSVPVHNPGGGSGVDEMLADPRFAPAAGDRVLVLAARGGRQRLQTALASRGVDVRELFVYRRRPASLDPAALQQLSEHFSHSAVVFTSVQILEQSLQLFDHGLPGPLSARPAVVISPRIADRARELGFRQVLIADGPDNGAIVAGLISLLGSIRPESEIR
ncbi:MAG: uroporphyrinogen-III synthase [Xanthomonadales bacterium]|nr:uroporphyrinogen-III synthase [Xanthomonadales bacterium]